MELAFRTRWLRDVCEDPAKATAQYGEQVSATLHARLADLHAASGIKDLVLGSPRIAGTKHPRLVVQIGIGQCLILQSNHVNATDLTGPVAWSSVNRLQVVSIGEEPADED